MAMDQRAMPDPHALCRFLRRAKRPSGWAASSSKAPSWTRRAASSSTKLRSALRIVLRRCATTRRVARSRSRLREISACERLSSDHGQVLAAGEGGIIVDPSGPSSGPPGKGIPAPPTGGRWGAAQSTCDQSDKPARFFAHRSIYCLETGLESGNQR